MIYRVATPHDIESIASLHTRSWQDAYKDILSEEFLTNEVPIDRHNLWSQRLNSPGGEQMTMVVEEAGCLAGFVCIFLNCDERYGQFGALLDNIHVATEQQRKGIGRQLMIRAMNWLREQDPESGMHLWVFEDNDNAIQFYKNLNGEPADKKLYTGIGENPIPAVRFVWQRQNLPT